MNFFITALSTEMSPLGADKNSLDWWKAKKEEYPAFDSHRVDISCKLTPLYLAL